MTTMLGTGGGFGATTGTVAADSPVAKLAPDESDANGQSPDIINFTDIMNRMTSRHTVELVHRHVRDVRNICTTCRNGFLLRHLEPLVELLKLVLSRFEQGQLQFAVAISDVTRVASNPFVSCKASDMITYGHHVPAFIRTLVSVLSFVLPPREEDYPLEVLKGTLDERRASYERVRVDISHTLACWARFGLEEESAELDPNQSWIQAFADKGTPNLRILRQSQVIDALSASFRAEDSPEAIVITLGAIRDMSLYRPLARQITNSGIVSDLVHVIRMYLLGSDVLLVAAEVLWNVLELDWEGASQAMGQVEVIESFRDFVGTVLAKGYRLRDRIFRNDMMVLLMYVSKRPENRPLFASTGLMGLLLVYAVTDAYRKSMEQTGLMRELMSITETSLGASYRAEGTGKVEAKAPTVQLTSTQEDMEFRMLLWSTCARLCADEDCAAVATTCGLVPSLLSHIDVNVVLPDKRLLSQEQHRKVQLDALSALFSLVQFMPDNFLEAEGCYITLQLLQATRSVEVQRKCLHLLQVAVRQGPHFADELGRKGAVGVVIELFADKDNPMRSRQLCASVLAGLCDNHEENCKEFRKKDGVEVLRAEVIYTPDESAENHNFYTISMVDCVWRAVVGTRKNEVRFLDAGGLFALLDVLEVTPMLLKRQIIGCLADLTQYRKAAKLFAQWNSQVTMKGALKILLELWQCEQNSAGSTAPDGVLRDIDRPLNPLPLATASASTETGGDGADSPDSDSTSSSGSRSTGRMRQTRSGAQAQQAPHRTRSGLYPPAGSSQTEGRTGVGSGAAASPSAFMGSTAEAFAERQDCRAKIYAILANVGFECQEALTIAEDQQMELVKIYPEVVQQEAWIAVKEQLDARGVRPVAADRQWMQNCIETSKQTVARVQNAQRELAEKRVKEELQNENKFYENLRNRYHFGRNSSSKDSNRGMPGNPASGYPAAGHASEMGDPWADDSP